MWTKRLKAGLAATALCAGLAISSPASAAPVVMEMDVHGWTKAKCQSELNLAISSIENSGYSVYSISYCYKFSFVQPYQGHVRYVNNN